MFCHNCGKELPAGRLACPACGADQTIALAAVARAKSQAGAPARPAIGERVGPGVFGMLLGAIVVLLLPIATEPMGIWVGVQGVCMGLVVFSGYRMLGWRLSGRGTAICAVGTVAAVALSETLVWMMFAWSAPVYLPYGNSELLGVLLKEGLAGPFALYLLQAVVFALAGGALLAVPDLRAQRLHPDRMPKLWPGLIFVAVIALVVASFALFASGENNDNPYASYAFQTVTHFMRGYAATLAS